MSSTFSGYNIARSGMSANQSALTVVSSNISNVDTAGYSRKQITCSEQVISQNNGESVGIGVDVEGVHRARNIFLDQTYRRDNANANYWSVKESNLEDIQRTLNETTSSSDDSTSTGLQQTIQDFFDSWEELSKDPSSQSSRQSVVENASVLVSTMQDIDDQLRQMQLDGVENVRENVKTLNDLAKQVGDLNQQIIAAESNGAEAGDLRDQRDTLLDQMSALADIKVNETSSGVLQVTLGGTALVNGGNIHSLAVAGDGSTENPLRVEWEETGSEAAFSSGSIQAHLQDSDQSGVTNITSFPYNYTASSVSSIGNLRQGLNALITTVASKLNELHQSGVDQEGNAGLAFFVPSDSTQPLSLSNIEVNPEITSDLDKLVTSTNGASGDNTIAESIYQLSDSKDFQSNDLSTDLNGYYQSLISWLSTAGNNASGYYDTQSALTNQVNTQRQSISSVSLDEEMTKMIKFQNAYDACAKVLTTIDSLLEGLLDEFDS